MGLTRRKKSALQRAIMRCDALKTLTFKRGSLRMRCDTHSAINRAYLRYNAVLWPNLTRLALKRAKSRHLPSAGYGDI